MKQINPEGKVLLSSGYSINGQAAEIMERPTGMKVLKELIQDRRYLTNIQKERW
jgi:hypothetical protein